MFRPTEQTGEKSGRRRRVADSVFQRRSRSEIIHKLSESGSRNEATGCQSASSLSEAIGISEERPFWPIAAVIPSEEKRLANPIS